MEYFDFYLDFGNGNSEFDKFKIKIGMEAEILTKALICKEFFDLLLEMVSFDFFHGFRNSHNMGYFAIDGGNDFKSGYGVGSRNFGCVSYLDGVEDLVMEEMQSLMLGGV